MMGGRSGPPIFPPGEQTGQVVDGEWERREIGPGAAGSEEDGAGWWDSLSCQRPEGSMGDQGKQPKLPVAAYRHPGDDVECVRCRGR